MICSPHESRKADIFKLKTVIMINMLAVYRIRLTVSFKAFNAICTVRCKTDIGNDCFADRFVDVVAQLGKQIFIGIASNGIGKTGTALIKMFVGHIQKLRPQIREHTD